MRLSPAPLCRAALVAWLGSAAITIVTSQNLLPNGSFEAGTNTPAGWRASDSRGTWTENAHSGRRAIRVEGNGRDSLAWRSESLTLKPGGLYQLRFVTRRDAGTTGGTAVAGLSRVSRDYHPGDEWQAHRFVFAVPSDPVTEYARFGQWNVNGRVSFDDAELVPVLVAHKRLPGGAELGEAESIRSGVYRFNPHLGWAGANYHRPLFLNRAAFNSDRWVFSTGAEVVYQAGVRGITQEHASVRVTMNYHVAGTLVIEAGRTTNEWRRVGALSAAQRTATLQLPQELFPADELFVRLRADAGSANFQVNAIDYQAPLAGSPRDAEGETHFLAVLDQSSRVAVQFTGVQQTNSGNWAVSCLVSNATAQPIQLRGTIGTNTGGSLRLSSRGVAPITFTAAADAPGARSLRIHLTDETNHGVFAGETDVRLHFLLDPRPGHWIAESEALGVWWCESGWKIGRDRAMPARPANGRGTPVRVSAARGEDEPVQVILRPRRDGELLRGVVTPLRNSRGETNRISVRIDEVAYVPVTQPTDSSCQRGLHPDPLPPLRTPLSLRGEENQPLWITFRVARDARAGEYEGELVLETTEGDIHVPLAVHVYDFALPKETHLRSAFGLGTREINRYHRLANAGDKERVFEKYLQNFADHRISPYSFFDYAPIEVQFTGEGTNKHAEVDFAKFDRAAERWLDEAGFSTFRLPLRGMGGGTFHSRHLGKLEGFDEGTPEHARLFADYLGQVERHLRNRGWLDKAFTYWFDEPDPKDYAFVVAGNKRIRAAAPGLRRMLTEQPEPDLLGNVEIWCGLTPEWTQEKVRARRAAGEEVWWYLCTGPKAPYVTLFTDHPGTELRLWPWQSWQYGVQGLLVWASVYWTSSAAFPAKPQDPWADPMSYVSGYDFKPGHVGFWGNGDGRFLYPPRAHAAGSGPLLDDPVNSVRWENLRDGMEDYEYFWLLEREVNRLRTNTTNTTVAELIKDAERLLVVPKEISTDLTHFTTDPRPMLTHRDRLARMIERLQHLK